MKTGWKKLKALLFRPLSYGKGLALNLALIILLLLGMWVRQGCPLPTAELEFRRLERTHLLPPSEIVFQTKAPGRTFALPDGPELRFTTQFVVGLREDRVTLCSLEDGDRALVSLPRGESPVLVPLLREGKYLELVGWYPYQIEENHTGAKYHLMFLLLDPPAETAQVELTVQGDGEAFSGTGWPMEDGNWLLGLESELVGYVIMPYRDAAYTLRFFTSDGALLLERTGDFNG